MDYTKHFNVRKTPQNRPIPGSNQVQNNTGGFVYGIDKWSQLDRFLILGSEGGTYYVSENKLTVENAKNLVECIKEDGIRVVNKTIEISEAGRAPKNDPAIFALALACSFGDRDTKQAAYNAITRVCRIGTHIFTFMQMAKNLRKWSRGLKTGISKYYTERSPEDLGYQLIKYKQRNGWSQKDVIKLTHPDSKRSSSPEIVNNLLRYAIEKDFDPEKLPEKVRVSLELGKMSLKEVAENIVKHKLPREVVPTEMLKEKVIWEALVENMPMTALIRNLNKLTSVGLLDNFSSYTTKVVDQLTNGEWLKKARVHPMSLLVAYKTYDKGSGLKGNLTWTPCVKVTEALEKAFYLSFDFVKPSGKNILIGIDVSGSMGWGAVGNLPISSAEAAACMAMVTARAESNYDIMGFAHTFKCLNIKPSDNLEQVLRKTSSHNFGSTDCALPMLYALKNKLPIDAFFVYTDNETWYGEIHPSQALKQYREQTGRNAKLVVVATESTRHSIADPEDPGMLDVVGFDTSTPQIMSEFIS